jgi:hypothetical protein
LALPGSKFEGIRLENEQIGQIQVAFEGVVVGVDLDKPNGLFVLETGDEAAPPVAAFLLSGCCMEP